ncbi:hypothetical protein PsorP6_013870 [Peronosclerospora sorghi]|uniref:Uncharacterized protein n=1 Tax=Peronosclerospora sorghi TaxID=230839 RepID=A0ACC0VH64_9STRA|nr:hypothetical protein PsorP6_013870 [Peronosclerospora sorghi]
MMQSIEQILEKVDTLDLTTLEPDLSASMCFHKKINDLLIAWGTCQLYALLIETPSEQDMAFLGGISRNLCKLLAHPSIIASEAQIVLWLSVLKNEMIIQRGKPFITDILEQLRQITYGVHIGLLRIELVLDRCFLNSQRVDHTDAKHNIMEKPSLFNPIYPGHWIMISMFDTHVVYWNSTKD